MSVARAGERTSARETGPAPEAHYRFLLWLAPAVERFPRRQKRLPGDRIQTTAPDVLDSLIEATWTRRRGAHLARGAFEGHNLRDRRAAQWDVDGRACARRADGSAQVRPCGGPPRRPAKVVAVRAGFMKHSWKFQADDRRTWRSYANAFGLRDVYGNVSGWAQDCLN